MGARSSPPFGQTDAPTFTSVAPEVLTRACSVFLALLLACSNEAASDTGAAAVLTEVGSGATTPSAAQTETKPSVTTQPCDELWLEEQAAGGEPGLECADGAGERFLEPESTPGEDPDFRGTALGPVTSLEFGGSWGEPWGGLGTYNKTACEACLKAAKGTSSQWNQYCDTYDATRPCRAHQFDTSVERTNYCNDNVCDK